MFGLALAGFIAVTLHSGCAVPDEGMLPADPILSVRLLPEKENGSTLIAVPGVREYHEALTASLNQANSILSIQDSELSPDQRAAQELVLGSTDFTRYSRHFETNEPLASEIMSIGVLEPSDVRKYKFSEPGGGWLYVDLFNYYYNQTVRAVVDVTAMQIILIDATEAGFPRLREKTKQLALSIALEDPELRMSLGVDDGVDIASLDPEFRITRFERSRHLGGAWVFTRENDVVWALVDLNDLRLFGTAITVPESAEDPIVISQRVIENTYMTREYCNQTHSVKQGEWEFTYQLTGSDGMEIRDVTFRGNPVINSAKLVDWHVRYDTGSMVGYTDAIGCPMFSAAAVVAYKDPQVVPITGRPAGPGFSFIMDFRSPVWPFACNYYYQNVFEFYEDGRFRIAGANRGLGCSGDAWYAPIFRIDLATSSGVDTQTVEQWTDSGWSVLTAEAWSQQTASTTYSAEGYQYRFNGRDRAFALEPNVGQFGDASRGDWAFTYITVPRREEGEVEMSTLGECCQVDERQGPEVFTNDETLAGKHVIIWYAPQMKNDARTGNEYSWASTRIRDGKADHISWPGTVGPMFVPVAGAASE